MLLLLGVQTFRWSELKFTHSLDKCAANATHQTRGQVPRAQEWARRGPALAELHSTREGSTSR